MSELEADYNEVMAAVTKMPKKSAENLLQSLAKHKEAMSEFDSGFGKALVGMLENRALYYADKVLHCNPDGENIIKCPACSARTVDVNSIYYQAYESAIAAVSDFVKAWYTKNHKIKTAAARSK